MRIAIDAMGGDHAPSEIVAGVLEASKTRPDLTTILVGPADRLKAELDRAGGALPNVEIEHAAEWIEMHEHPVEAFRKKRDSSIGRGIRLMREKRADAFISAGNTGACVAGATIGLGLLDNVKRAGICVPMPSEKSFTALVDVGANINCRPINLVQYAVMGSIFVRCLDSNRPTPTVGLLNVGAEAGKGDQLVQAAYDYLAQSHLNFVGNVEGHDIFNGSVDVVVADGFVGNSVLKAGEGLASLFMSKMRATLPQGELKRVAQQSDFSEIGAAPLLGVKGIVLIAHGRSKARALRNSVLAAATFIQNRLVELIVEDMKKLGQVESLA